MLTSSSGLLELSTSATRAVASTSRQAVASTSRHDEVFLYILYAQEWAGTSVEG